MEKKKYRKILQELVRKQRIPRAIKKKHGDIEEAIVAAGGSRGGVRRVDA